MTVEASVFSYPAPFLSEHLVYRKNDILPIVRKRPFCLFTVPQNGMLRHIHRPPPPFNVLSQPAFLLLLFNVAAHGLGIHTVVRYGLIALAVIVVREPVCRLIYPARLGIVHTLIA